MNILTVEDADAVFVVDACRAIDAALAEREANAAAAAAKRGR